MDKVALFAHNSVSAMEIRQCTYNDIPLMQQISMQSYTEHYKYLWHDGGEGYIRAHFSMEQLEKEMSDVNSVYFLLFSMQAPVGILKLNVDKAIEEYTAEESLELERIYFIHEATGKGAGKETIDFVTAFAK